MAKKAETGGRARKPRAPAPLRRRLATEPVEEAAGRVRRIALHAANDNQRSTGLGALGRPALLALVSAAIGGLIAGLLLN